MVEGERLSVIFHTPQHLNRLLPNDWEELRQAGFPVDEIWQGGLINETEEELIFFERLFYTMLAFFIASIFGRYYWSRRIKRKS